MAEPDPANENVREYVRRLTPQVRSRLLAELERLHLVGQSIPRTEALIAALRAEFRDTGQSHYRVGNPSRYFFEPLEAVLVNGAPERANGGQIARVSLAPIWSLITEKLLPSMAADYIASAKKFIVANNLNEAQRMAAAFRKKIVTYLDGVLGSADGVATVRAGLEAYTSSRAIYDDLTKMLRLMHAHEALAEFSSRLPPKIKGLDSEFPGQDTGPVGRTQGEARRRRAVRPDDHGESAGNAVASDLSRDQGCRQQSCLEDRGDPLCRCRPDDARPDR